MSHPRRFVLLFALPLLAAMPVFAAGGGMRSRALGVMAGRGSVWVDDEMALSGTALFPGEVVRTGRDAAAIMSFESGTSITLAGDGEIVLPRQLSSGEFDLRRGAAVIAKGGAEATRVRLLGVSVEVRGERYFPTICRLAVVGETAAVFNDRGVVKVSSSRGWLPLAAGKFIHFEAGNPPGAPPQQKAGSVSAQLPLGTIQRQGVGPATTLLLNEDINWQDVVQTQKQGRVRIQLLDGSVLNVGARSTMRILQHDPQAQQTAILFTLGKVRAQVVKLSKPNASFTVRTQTAVIGVVGTDFIVVASAKRTRVFCLEGVVSVSNISPAILGAVQLHPGQSTVVPRGAPPASATTSNPSQVQAQVSQTEINPGVVTAATAAANVATNAATVAATGTSAALGGVAVSKINSANDLLSQTNKSLQSADASSSSAVTAANSATAAANNAATSTQTILNAVSTSQPICGCTP